MTCDNQNFKMMLYRVFNINLRHTTVISDEDLDIKIKEVVGSNRAIGPNSIRVRLAERNIFTTRQKVRDGCARVDPGGCALRSLERRNIHSRTYKVAGPNSLWHLDGNHKLIRYMNSEFNKTIIHAVVSYGLVCKHTGNDIEISSANP